MADTSYMARKSVADIVGSADVEGGHSLSKTLGATSITAMGIGAIIGAGIFVLTGTAAAQFAGPSIVLSFVLGGIACAFVGLCYSELAAMLPVCGSSYTYTYATLGEIFAWIIGWDLILEYAMGAATVAVGWSGYIVSLLHNVGINFPPVLSTAPGTVIKLADGTTATGIVNLPAVLIIAILTTLLVLGTKESARLNNIMVAVKLVVVVAFIALGVFFIKPANWHPFIPPNTGEFGNFGMSGILRGSAVVFFAFIGFDAVSTAAQEAKKPQRDMPIGILGSLVICTLLYILVAGVLTGLVPYADLNVPDPIAKGVDAIGLTWFSVLIKIGALTGLDHRDSRAAVRTEPHLLHDVAGRLATASFRTGSSASSDASSEPDTDWHDRRSRGGADADQRARRDGQHRHAVRVHPGVRRRDLSATQRLRCFTPVPGSCRAARAGSGDLVLPVADGGTAACHVGAALRMAGDRTGHLCDVWS